jgi:hypothetical protein
MNGVNRGIFRLLPIFLLLFLGVSSCSQKEEWRILVIHSYEETYAAYPEFNRMIAEQFEKEKMGVGAEDFEAQVRYTSLLGTTKMYSQSYFMNFLSDDKRNVEDAIIKIN